jgi:serine/threonine protein kinase
MLVDHGIVLLTDFGLSVNFMDASGSTTQCMTINGSSRYCAPEVVQLESQNTKLDIWSLGVVFMEMIIALEGKTREDMDTFFEEHGTSQRYISLNPGALSEFAAELAVLSNKCNDRALKWAQSMLQANHKLRPSASSLIDSVIASDQETEGPGFCGICCIASEGDYSNEPAAKPLRIELRGSAIMRWLIRQPHILYYGT